MENMLHLSPAPATLPASYVIPPHKIPPATSAIVSLPVVDMSRGRDEVCRAILEAGKEFGFFQVVNHGVSEEAMRDMEAVCEEFYGLPAADKAHLYSEDKDKPIRLFSGATYSTSGEKYWLDCLRLACPFPAGDTTDGWPDKPNNIREVFRTFLVQTWGVGMELLRLLAEGMGLRPDYFDGDLSRGDAILSVNRYPPCPDPAKALGLPPHCDRNLITLLFPGPVPGLELFHDGHWIKFHPVPDAFVVNFGLQLEVVTNGMLKSIEHRVMTNSALPRTSVALFMAPTEDCLVGPAQEFLGDHSPPCYRTMTFRDFRRTYSVVRMESSLNFTTNLKDVQKQI